jgi:hypothetical protein
MSDYTQDAAERDRDRRERILSAIMKFARQRPGIDPRNYFETWRESEGVKAYRQEVREVTADLADLREIMRSVRWRESITAGDLLKATRAYSGRLQIIEDSARVKIEYCTGQYFPTEYRRAACSVLAQALWDYHREDVQGHPRPGDKLREKFARMFPRRIARRYFE